LANRRVAIVEATARVTRDRVSRVIKLGDCFDLPVGIGHPSFRVRFWRAYGPKLFGTESADLWDYPVLSAQLSWIAMRTGTLFLQKGARDVL
jgi:hypothetical protein